MHAYAGRSGMVSELVFSFALVLVLMAAPQVWAIPAARLNSSSL